MKKSRIRTNLIIFAIGLVVCFGAILALCRDETPPKDDDLRFVRRIIPDDENAIYYFIQAARKIYVPAGGWLSEERQWKADSTGEVAREVIDLNSEMFELMEKGLACPDALAPEPLRSTRYGLSKKYLNHWRSTAELFCLRAHRLAKNGHAKEAMDELLKAVTFGQLIENCRGGFKCYMTGSDIRSVGLFKMRKLLADTTLDHAALKSYIPALDSRRADKEALADTVKLEYPIAAEGIYNVLSGQDEVLSSLGGTKMPIWSYSFKPNETKRMLADAHRMCLANIPKKASDQTPFELSKEFISPRPFSPERSFFAKARLLLARNGAGKRVYQNTAYLLSVTPKIKCRDEDSITATQISIALKCHKLRTGDLPESLDELVPEYFDQVPKDNWDGRPMRYSKEKKSIYVKRAAWMFGEKSGPKDDAIEIGF